MSAAPVLEASQAGEYFCFASQLVDRQGLRRAISGLDEATRRDLALSRAILPGVIVWEASSKFPVVLDEYEQELLTKISLGTPATAIARQRGYSELTGNAHAKKVYDKLGAKNAAPAVATGICLGLITPELEQPYEGPWLDTKELTICRLIGLGLTNKEIPKSSGLSMGESAVDSALIDKVRPITGLGNRPYIVRRLFELGIFQVKPPGIDLKPKG